MRRAASIVALLALTLAATKARADADDDRNFHIKQGDHDAKGKGLGVGGLHLGRNHDRVLRYTVIFTGDVPYSTANAGNQSDWNKLMGISCDRIHHNSIRLGWAWNPKTNSVDLGFYGYIQGARYMPYLTSVPLNTPVQIEIRYNNNGETVIANGVRHDENRSLGLGKFFPSPSWIMHTAYFGGDETAPHDIDVQVRNVSFQ